MAEEGGQTLRRTVTAGKATRAAIGAGLGARRGGARSAPARFLSLEPLHYHSTGLFWMKGHLRCLTATSSFRVSIICSLSTTMLLLTQAGCARRAVGQSSVCVCFVGERARGRVRACVRVCVVCVVCVCVCACVVCVGWGLGWGGCERSRLGIVTRGQRRAAVSAAAASATPTCHCTCHRTCLHVEGRRRARRPTAWPRRVWHRRRKRLQGASAGEPARLYAPRAV